MYIYGVIIVNYNNFLDTIECLESLLESSYEKFHLFIVDNSTNEIDYLKIKNYLSERNYSFSEKESSVEKINLRKIPNRGFSNANNVILKENHSCIDYYWLLNNDTVVSKDFLSQINERLILRDEKAEIYSTTLLFYGSNIIQAIGGIVNKYTGKGKHLFSEEHFDPYKKYDVKADYPIGANIFISRDLINKVGYLAEDYFLYYEELDWVERAKKYKVKIVIFTELTLQHKAGKSIGEFRDSVNPNQLIWLNKSRLMWQKKFYPQYYIIGKVFTIFEFFLSTSVFLIKRQV